MSKRKQRAPRGVALLLLTAVAGGYLFKMYADVDRRYAAVYAQAAAVEREVERALAHKQQLEAQIAALHTDAEIEKQARERLGLIRAGEIPVLVQPDADD